MKNKRQKSPLADAVGREWVERDNPILGYVTIAQTAKKQSLDVGYRNGKKMFKTYFPRPRKARPWNS